MESWLNHLWLQLKAHKAGVLVLFIIVVFGLLTFVALVSDIGFSEEIKEYRYTILYSVSGIAVIYIVVWIFVHIIKENTRLGRQIKDLQRTVDSHTKNIKTTNGLIELKDEEIVYLRQTILILIQEITAGRVFEVAKLQFYKKKLFLTLRRKEELQLNKGDEIRVIDLAEGYLMGVFEVTEVRETDYMARSKAYISPVWLGHVNQPGNAESSAPPDSIAVYFPSDDNYKQEKNDSPA